MQQHSKNEKTTQDSEKISTKYEIVVINICL